LSGARPPPHRGDTAPLAWRNKSAAISPTTEPFRLMFENACPPPLSLSTARRISRLSSAASNVPTAAESNRKPTIALVDRSDGND